MNEPVVALVHALDVLLHLLKGFEIQGVLKTNKIKEVNENKSQSGSKIGRRLQREGSINDIGGHRVTSKIEEVSNIRREQIEIQRKRKREEEMKVR